MKSPEVTPGLMSFACTRSEEGLVLATDLSIQIEARVARITSSRSVRLIFSGSSRLNLLILDISTQMMQVLPQDDVWGDLCDINTWGEYEILSSEIEDSTGSAEIEQ